VIVVGSKSHSLIHRSLLGSLSSYLVNHAQIPVLVVRGHSAQEPAPSPPADATADATTDDTHAVNQENFDLLFDEYAIRDGNFK